jgi:uncharacterized beta-barrel protein YwiB (DUF1934 family)
MGGKYMQSCKLTITTSVDEQENTVVYDGKIDKGEANTVLTYEDGASRVCITLQKGVAFIDRQGDYSLRLRLEEGETHESNLGINGAEGKVFTRAHRVKYTLDRNIFKLSLRYDLIFTENEVQKMKLNLKAQIKNR